MRKDEGAEVVRRLLLTVMKARSNLSEMVCHSGMGTEAECELLARIDPWLFGRDRNFLHCLLSILAGYKDDETLDILAVGNVLSIARWFMPHIAALYAIRWDTELPDEAELLRATWDDAA